MVVRILQPTLSQRENDIITLFKTSSRRRAALVRVREAAPLTLLSKSKAGSSHSDSDPVRRQVFNSCSSMKVACLKLIAGVATAMKIKVLASTSLQTANGRRTTCNMLCGKGWVRTQDTEPCALPPALAAAIHFRKLPAEMCFSDFQRTQHSQIRRIGGIPF